MEYYSAIKKDEIMPLTVTWMDLEIIIPSQIRQKKSINFSHRCHKEFYARSVYLQIYFSEVNEGHLLLQHLLQPSFLFWTIVNVVVPFFLSPTSSAFHVPFFQDLLESKLEESCVLLHLFHVGQNIHKSAK